MLLNSILKKYNTSLIHVIQFSEYFHEYKIQNMAFIWNRNVVENTVQAMQLGINVYFRQPEVLIFFNIQFITAFWLCLYYGPIIICKLFCWGSIHIVQK